LWLPILAAVALAIPLVVSCGDDTSPVTETAAGANGPGPGSGAGGVGGETSGTTTVNPTFAGGGGQGGSTSTMAGPGGGGEGGMGSFTYVLHKVFQNNEDANAVTPRDIVVDATGNIIVVGGVSKTSYSFGGVSLPGKGLDDVFVAKYDAAGNHVWSKRYGGTFSDSAAAVDVDGGGSVWICGTWRSSITFGQTTLTGDNQNNDVFIAKLAAADGMELFVDGFPNGNGSSDECNDLAVDPSGNVLITGYYQGHASNNIDFGGGPLTAPAGEYEVFIAKFTQAGLHAFSKRIVGADGHDDRGNALDVSADGAFFVVGGFASGDINLGGGVIGNSAGQRAFIAKYKADGTYEIGKLLAGGGDAEVTSIAIHSSGNIFFGGTFKSSIDLGQGDLKSANSTKDAFVGRYDGGLGYLYGTRLGGNGVDEGRDVAVDSDLFAFVVGNFTQEFDVNSKTKLAAADNLPDAYLVGLGPVGNGYSGRSFGAMGYQSATVVTTNAMGEVLIAGQYSGSPDFGKGAELLVGKSDLFFGKYQLQ
jgi:hypothetical protein